MSTTSVGGRDCREDNWREGEMRRGEGEGEEGQIATRFNLARSHCVCSCLSFPTPTHLIQPLWRSPSQAVSPADRLVTLASPQRL